MKMYEMEKAGRYGIGFIDPNTINENTWLLEACRKDKEISLFESIKIPSLCAAGFFLQPNLAATLTRGRY